MCIIAAKPIGIKLPKDTTLENMWYSNDDGAGFMWAEKGKVHIRKGFMTYDDFKKALDKFCSTHDAKYTAMVLHFRITTHGGTNPANCHPFPISDSVGMLSKLESKCMVGVAHNGVIPITPRKDISDTMEYVASQLAPLSRAVPDFYRNKNLCEMIRNATKSKLAFLNGKGEIYTIGDFVEDNGILYSNSTYKYMSFRDFGYRYSSGAGWRDYDDYGYDYPSSKDFYEDDGGCYYMRDVMWLYADFGYVTGVDDIEDLDACAIDSYGNLYNYDTEKDALVKIPGAVAHNDKGVSIRFDSKSPYVMEELIYCPYTKGTGKKSKK